MLTIKDAVPQIQKHIPNQQVCKRFLDHLKHHGFTFHERDILPFFTMIADNPKIFFQFKAEQKSPATQRNIICAISQALDTPVISKAIPQETLDAIRQQLTDAKTFTSNATYPIALKSPIPVIIPEQRENVDIVGESPSSSDADDEDNIPIVTDDPHFDIKAVDTSDYEINTGFTTTTVQASNNQVMHSQDSAASAKLLDCVHHMKTALYENKELWIEKMQSKQQEIAKLQGDITEKNKEIDAISRQLREAQERLAIVSKKNPSTLQIYRIIEDYKAFFDNIITLSSLQPQFKSVFESTIERLFAQLKHACTE
jgi:hypothetical protein